MGFVQALLIGVLYWYCRTSVGYTFCIRINSCPMILALPIGLIMGNVPQAMIIGTFLQVVYLGIQGGFGGVLGLHRRRDNLRSRPLRYGVDPHRRAAVF